MATIKNRKLLTAVFPAVAMKEDDLKAIVHTAVREALGTATATDLPRVVPPLQHQMSKLNSRVSGLKRPRPDDRGHERGRGDRGRRGRTFHHQPYPPPHN